MTQRWSPVIWNRFKKWSSEDYIHTNITFNWIEKLYIRSFVKDSKVTYCVRPINWSLHPHEKVLLRLSSAHAYWRKKQTRIHRPCFTENIVICYCYKRSTSSSIHWQNTKVSCENEPTPKWLHFQKSRVETIYVFFTNLKVLCTKNST